jgi:Ice-binding-like
MEGTHSMTARRHHLSVLVFPVALALSSVVLVGNTASAAEAPVGLGTAASFAVIAGTTVTNTGPSVISGDVGVSPGTAIVGFPPGIVNNGTVHAADAVAAQAQADVTTAYNDAAGRTTTATVTADLGGQTLVSGVYTGATLGLTGTVTLDAQGDPTAVFIFQTASTLITASASVVALTNGANPCNVFWLVASSATLGTNSVFVGTVLALTSVTATTTASVNGRLLARNAAVTLDSNTITNSCAAAPTTTTTAATGATTPAVSTTTQGSTITTPPILPGTGASTSPQLFLAFGLVAAGVIMVLRRRDKA